MVDTGNRIKLLRTEKRLTQLQLADRLGITKSMVSAYETESRLPSYDVLVKIASIFGVSCDYLLGLDSQRSIDTTGLTDKQTEIVSNLVDEFKRYKPK